MELATIGASTLACNVVSGVGVPARDVAGGGKNIPQHISDTQAMSTAASRRAGTPALLLRSPR